MLAKGGILQKGKKRRRNLDKNILDPIYPSSNAMVISAPGRNMRKGQSTRKSIGSTKDSFAAMSVSRWVRQHLRLRSGIVGSRVSALGRSNLVCVSTCLMSAQTDSRVYVDLLHRRYTHNVRKGRVSRPLLAGRSRIISPSLLRLSTRQLSNTSPDARDSVFDRCGRRQLP